MLMLIMPKYSSLPVSIIENNTKYIAQVIEALSAKLFNQGLFFYSQIHKSLYVEHSSIIDLTNIANDLGNVRLSFTVYLLKNVPNEDHIEYSYSNFKEKELKIVSFHDGKEFSHQMSFYIRHELTKLSQNVQRKQTQENLYEVAIDYSKDGDYYRSLIGQVFYYTIPQVQKRLSQQFFKTLMEKQSRLNYDDIVKIEDFKDYDELKNELLKVDKDTISSYINDLGLTYEWLMQLVHYAFKRLEAKLYKSYRLYQIRTNIDVENIQKVSDDLGIRIEERLEYEAREIEV
jgi:hypothetical protein